jgi:hypothetical protein
LRGRERRNRITLKIEKLGAELAAVTARLNDLQLTVRPIRIPKRMVDDTIAQFEGILERAPLDTRVATLRDLSSARRRRQPELKAVAVWNVTTDQGAIRSMRPSGSQLTAQPAPPPPGPMTSLFPSRLTATI